MRPALYGWVSVVVKWVQAEYLSMAVTVGIVEMSRRALRSVPETRVGLPAKSRIIVHFVGV